MSPETRNQWYLSISLLKSYEKITDSKYSMISTNAANLPTLPLNQPVLFKLAAGKGCWLTVIMEIFKWHVLMVFKRMIWWWWAWQCRVNGLMILKVFSNQKEFPRKFCYSVVLWSGIGWEGVCLPKPKPSHFLISSSVIRKITYHSLSLYLVFSITNVDEVQGLEHPLEYSLKKCFNVNLDV